jgi:hypothetical protein
MGVSLHTVKIGRRAAQAQCPAKRAADANQRPFFSGDYKRPEIGMFGLSSLSGEESLCSVIDANKTALPSSSIACFTGGPTLLKALSI